ncbi:SRPBCC family protein [Nocardia sp. NPDC056100]|uniref:type II toxin-antitoxin system Rv0910 family toxin n=1 Tax=Nocardia sp. NPDC056100 TaxID=3345712 RepID=UPI0035DBF560
MAHIEVTKLMNVNPARLYATIADPSTWGQWFAMHDTFVGEPPKQIAVNSRMVQNVHVLGMSHRVELTVTSFRPPMHLVLSGSSAAGVACEFRFSVRRQAGGSELTLSGDFTGPALTGGLMRAVDTDVVAKLEASLDRLAALAEAA